MSPVSNVVDHSLRLSRADYYALPIESSGLELIPDKKVADLIEQASPRGSRYETLSLLLRRQQVRIVQIDQGEHRYFARSDGERNIEAFKAVGAGENRPTLNIYVTRAYFDARLKGAARPRAALILRSFAEQVFAAHLNRGRYVFAFDRAQEFASGDGFGAEFKVKTEAMTCAALLRWIESYDVRQDPDNIELAAVYAALSKFRQIELSTGTALLAWYRYMLEARPGSAQSWTVTEVIPNITRLIMQAVSGKGRHDQAAVRIDAHLISKQPLISNQPTGDLLSLALIDARSISKQPSGDPLSLTLSDYNPQYVFPYQREDYQDGEIILLPQCAIDLAPTDFKRIELSTLSNKPEFEKLASQIRGAVAIDHGPTADLEVGLTKPDAVAVVGAILASARKIAKQQERAVLIGVLAPGGAGKTTLSLMLNYAARATGLRSAYLGCDAYLQPGNGYRYDFDPQREPYRHTHIAGPGIYDEEALWRDLAHLKQGHELRTRPDAHAGSEVETIGPDLDLIVSDGVFLGLSRDIADLIDILVCLIVDQSTEETRLDLKWRRDSDCASTHNGIHLPLDFAEKQYLETVDCLRPLSMERANFVWLREQRELHVRI